MKTSNPLDVLQAFVATGDSRFASLTYTNQHGETSKYLLHLNVKYLKVLARDLKVLGSLKTESEIEEQARQKLTASLQLSLETKGHNPNYTKDGYYTRLVHGVKYHDDQLYVNAFVVSRTVIKAGFYPTVNHKPLTVAQNKLKKLLKSGSFREFKIDMNQIDEVKANGKTLEIVAR
jgi:hypothetical protein